MKAETRFTLQRYGVAVFMVVAMLVVSLLFYSVLKETPFAIFYAAVMVSAWYGGLRPGLLSVAMAALIVSGLFIQPTSSLAVSSSSDMIRVGLFIVVGTQISFLSELLHRARRRAEDGLRALHASEENYRHIIETAEEGIWRVDAKDRTTFVNTRLTEMLGYRAEEMIGQTPFAFLDEESEARAREGLERRRQGIREVCEYRFRRRDGSDLWALAAVKPLLDERGRYAGAVGMITDITEHKRAERQLRESELKFRLLAESAASAILLHRDDGQFVYVNPAAERMTGYTRAELLGLKIWDLLHPHFRAAVEQRLRARQAGESIVNENEVMMVIKSGETRWVSYTAGRMIIDKTPFVIAMATDITERRRAEDEVRRSQKLLQDIIDNSPALIYVKDLSGRFILVNRHVATLLGCTEEEVTGKTTHELVTKEDADRHCANDLEVLETGRPLTCEELQHEADGVRTYYSVKFPLSDEDGRPIGVGGISIDITERKRAEEALAQSENHLRTIVETEPECVKLIGKDGSLLEVNPAGLAMIEADSLAQAQANLFSQIVTPADRMAFKRLVDRVLKGESGKLEFEIVGLKGTRRWVETHTVPLRDTQGGIVAALGITRDITARRQAEEQIRHSNKQLRALSARMQVIREEEGMRIAREIHDELGSALTGLKWDLEGIERALFESDAGAARPQLRAKIGGMMKELDATLATVRRISSELRPGVLDDLGLVAAIEWQAEQFQERTGIECVCDLCAEEATLSKESSIAVFRIFQEILTNVLRHAQATHINIRMFEDEGQFVLEVEDNGRGITDAEKSDPRSLGLLGMHERAHLVGGQIRLRGTPGRGTTVTVRVPLSGAGENNALLTE